MLYFFAYTISSYVRPLHGLWNLPEMLPLTISTVITLVLTSFHFYQQFPNWPPCNLFCTPPCTLNSNEHNGHLQPILQELPFAMKKPPNSEWGWPRFLRLRLTELNHSSLFLAPKTTYSRLTWGIWLVFPFVLDAISSEAACFCLFTFQSKCHFSRRHHTLLL